MKTNIPMVNHRSEIKEIEILRNKSHNKSQNWEINVFLLAVIS